MDNAIKSTDVTVASQAPETEVKAPLKWRERLAFYQTKYGLIKGTWVFLRGEKPPQLKESETPLPVYAQWLVYTGSAANLFMFGSAELFAILKFGLLNPLSILLAIPLVLVFQLVYSIDRGAVRTLPRVRLLAQRKEYGMFTEHLAFTFFVVGLEGTILGYLIYVLENHIDWIEQQKPLLPGGFVGIFVLLGVRIVLYVWSILHAEFIKEKLPVQWGTLVRMMTESFGGSVREEINALDPSQLDVVGRVKMLNVLLEPPKRAPFSFRRRRRQEAQAIFDKQHRDTVEAVMQEAFNGTAVPKGDKPVLLSQLPAYIQDAMAPVLERLDAMIHVPETTAANVDHLFAAMRAEVQDWIEQVRQQFAEQLEELREAASDGKVVSMNSTGSGNGRSNPARPVPGMRNFPKWVYDQAYELMRNATQGQVVNLASLAEQAGHEPEIVGKALQDYRPTVERRLKSGETMADNLVYANPFFLLPEKAEA